MATEAQWHQLVRRAVGVPDLIGDQVALAMVTDVVFSSELQSQPRSDDDDVIAEAVWAAVVKLGAAEELDAFLMERSSRTVSSIGTGFTTAWSLTPGPRSTTW